MFMFVIVGGGVIMLFICVGLMSMGLLLRLGLWKRVLFFGRFVISMLNFVLIKCFDFDF